MDNRLSLIIIAALGLTGAACSSMGGGTSDEGSSQSTTSGSSQGTSGSDTGTSGSSGTTGSTDTMPQSGQDMTGSNPNANPSNDQNATASGDTQQSTVGANADAEIGSDQSAAAGTAAPSAAPGAAGPSAAASELVGRQVVSSTGEPLGSVVQVVVDAAGAPAYVVVSDGTSSTVVPHTVAASMTQNNQIVMDQARLQGAPKVQGDLQAQSSDTWRSAADAYWGQESIRTASPDMPSETTRQ